MTLAETGTVTVRPVARRRWLMHLLVGSVAVLIVAAVTGLYACHKWHQTPFMAAPDRLSICGREFSGPGSVFTGQQLQQEHDVRIGTVMTWQGHREVWGRHLTVGRAPGCGTGVYLRVSLDVFRGYDLLGGP
jgi:hypothetical protein